MDYSAIAVRYAKALFSLANEKNLLDELKSDMNLFSSLFEGKELKLIFNNQSIQTVQKIALLRNSFEGKINPLSQKFMELAITNGRSNHFEGMCKYFIQLYRKHKNLKSVILTTAVEIGEDISTKLVAKLEQELQTNIELQTAVNPALIGGFVLRIDNQQYDASIQHKLQVIKTTMLQTEL